VCVSVCLSVALSVRCDWLTGYYLRKVRHRLGLRLTLLGGLTKRPPKSSNKGDCSPARNPHIHIKLKKFQVRQRFVPSYKTNEKITA
jgi:hypothetical protein